MKNSIDFQISELFFRLHSSIRDKFEIRDEITIDLTLNQIQILIYVYEHGQPQISDIAKHFKVTLPTVSINLNLLEEKEFIKRVQDTQDRRITRIQITPSHMDRMKRAKQQKEQIMKRLLSRLSDSEKNQFAKLLGKIV